MAQMKFFKVLTLPETLEGNAFYYIANGEYAESYLTNGSGVPKGLGNTAMINALINAALAASQSAANEVEIVATIAARDTLFAAATANKIALVINATGDSTVASGSALYAYAKTGNTVYKVAEYESMDVVMTWAGLQGRPSSSAAQIDSAVAASHAHSNSAVLDKLSEAGGLLQYNGAPLTTDWATNNW